ncbi:MAG TPA: magnesium transporter CorA family protein [Desulfobacteria bacterium]|nr:magnesium transporter CorA family protein [Desulfobacteria bacterium]
MNIKSLDFSVPKAVTTFLSGWGMEISDQEFSKVNNYGGRRSFVRQLQGSALFVFLYREQNPIKLILNKELFLYHHNGELAKKIEWWATKHLFASPNDLLGLIGLELLDKLAKQIDLAESSIEALEERILDNPQKPQQVEIFRLHRKAIYLKKQLNQYLSLFVTCKEQTQVWDELIVRVQAELENARQVVELTENLREAYQASVDNRLNDIMKLLTILATVLLPINLLTSFFGMNFERMPLIHRAYGLDVFYAVSAAILIGSFVYFRRRNWF